LTTNRFDLQRELLDLETLRPFGLRVFANEPTAKL
jgi:hypothetical protein